MSHSAVDVEKEEKLCENEYEYVSLKGRDYIRTHYCTSVTAAAAAAAVVAQILIVVNLGSKVSLLYINVPVN